MFSSRKSFEGIDTLFLELKKYLEFQKEYVKLSAAEKLTVMLSAVVVTGVLLVLCSIVLLFLTLALAYFLGDAVGSLPLGFSLVALLVVLLAGMFYANRNRFVIQPLARFVVQLILTEEEHDDK